ncbi:Alpha/Beta hydrolase protein [Coprinopsis sp. MPI-PUGE-AT-0042]|nr:Alpha/Beta hydrolase protein [Coprinopsis sp. MPI-PUGE-AT-0042]
MYFNSLLAFLVASKVIALSAQGAPKCSTTILPISVNAINKELKITAPKTQFELTGFATRFNSETSNVTAEVVGGDVPNNKTYNIWTQLCLPATQDEKKTVEITVHGYGFDHQYWNFGGPGSKYNYVEAALKSGHGVLIFDRLGTGNSSKPDGITEVQTPTETEITAELVRYLKNKPNGAVFDRVIGVGHSYGSVLLINVASKYPDLLDASVITGFAPYGPAFRAAFAGFAMTIAKLNNPIRLVSLPTSYWVSPDLVANQQVFYRYPSFDSAVILAAEANKGTITLGELLTQNAEIALSYTKPVFAVTGDRDYPFCAGNCWQEVDGNTNIVSLNKLFFPSVDKFDVYIPAETGHNANLHHSSQEVFGRIQEWISEI